MDRRIVRWLGRGILAACAVYGVFMLRDSTLGRTATAALHAAWYDKSVQFSGRSAIDDSELRALLPWDRSVLWWMMHSAVVSSALKAHPMVEEIEVRSCGVLSWGCFHVSVHERHPTYVVSGEDHSWIAASDGSFLVEATSDHLHRFFSIQRKPIVILGVDRRSASAELIRARVQAIHPVVRSVEERQLIVKSVEYRPNEEIEVAFEELPLHVVFSLGGDGSIAIADQLERFATVLDHYQGQVQTIKKVDLAFRKAAVVSLIE